MHKQEMYLVQGLPLFDRHLPTNSDIKVTVKLFSIFIYQRGDSIPDSLLEFLQGKNMTNTNGRNQPMLKKNE